MDQDPDDYRQDARDDPALYDEDEGSVPDNAQSGGANTKGAINAGRTKGGNIAVAPEDRVSPADREEDLPLADDGAAEDPSFPARVNVMIEKPGKGTLQVETTAQDGEIVIDNVYYFKDTELADAKTAELDWKRRNLYEGPPFGNLDEDLQVLLERYLDERGVNTALAMWVPEYIDFKEQREYLDWLSSKSISPRFLLPYTIHSSHFLPLPILHGRPADSFYYRCENIRGRIGYNLAGFFLPEANLLFQTLYLIQLFPLQA